MGRRKPAVAFSLFSFQDIITSVSAILILVMLLLTIELVTRRRQQGATDPAESRRQIAASAEKLQALAAELRDEFATRRTQRPGRSLEAARQERERVMAELESVKRRLGETRRMREAAHAHVAAIEADARARVGEIAAIEGLEKQLAEDRREVEQLDEANRIERERQEKRRHEIVDAPRSGTELVFNPPVESDRRAWLVEVSGDGIVVVLLGGDRTERLGGETGPGSRYARWLSELTEDGDYCLLLVRPSVADETEQGVEQALTDAGVRFGIDLIGEDQVVRDGSKLTAR